MASAILTDRLWRSGASAATVMPMPIEKAIQAKAQKDLGLTLKAIRSALDISSAEALAHTSGFHPSQIADIERGAKNPSFAMLVQMAQKLGLTLAEIGAIYDQIAAGLVPDQPSSERNADTSSR
jgi:transcriptional regulator with XRE-family HTH domain